MVYTAAFQDTGRHSVVEMVIINRFQRYLLSIIIWFIQQHSRIQADLKYATTASVNYFKIHNLHVIPIVGRFRQLNNVVK